MTWGLVANQRTKQEPFRRRQSVIIRSHIAYIDPLHCRFFGEQCDLVYSMGNDGKEDGGTLAEPIQYFWWWEEDDRNSSNSPILYFLNWEG